MPEHAYAEGASSGPTLRVPSPSAAEFVCDARCQAGPCCQIPQECEDQQGSIRHSVGDCIPDGQGGCLRSTPESPCGCCSPTSLDLPQGALLQILASSGVPLIFAFHVFQNNVVRVSNAIKVGGAFPYRGSVQDFGYRMTHVLVL